MTDQHRTTQNLLEKKLAAYEDFLSATCLLKSALKSVDMPLVEGAVSRRADLIGLIDDLDQELAKLRKDEPAGEGEEALAKVTADLHSTLQQIEAINVECAALAEQGYQSLAGEIDRSTQERNGLRGYGGPTQATGDPRFVSYQT